MRSAVRFRPGVLRARGSSKQAITCAISADMQECVGILKVSRRAAEDRGCLGREIPLGEEIRADLHHAQLAGEFVHIVMAPVSRRRRPRRESRSTCIRLSKSKSVGESGYGGASSVMTWSTVTRSAR